MGLQAVVKATCRLALLATYRSALRAKGRQRMRSSLAVLFRRHSRGLSAPVRRSVFLHFRPPFSMPLLLRTPLVAGALKRLLPVYFITNFIKRALFLRIELRLKRSP